MKGRTVGLGIIGIAAIAGAAMYYLQVYAFYHPVDAGADGIVLTRLDGGTDPVPVEGFEAIDSDSSPIRFRACFRVPQSLATLTETYQPYPDPVPLTAPGWFGCFDAGDIEAALETGEATAFLSEKNIHYGVDRVVAVYDDGRAYAWHQLNNCGETDYSGTPEGEACPPREGN